MIGKIQTNHPEIGGTQEFKDFYRQVREQEYDRSLKVSETRVSRNPEALMRQVIGIKKNNPGLAKTEEFQAFSHKVEELYAEKLKKPESKNFKPLD